MSDKNDIDRGWFKKWFNAEYLRLYGHRNRQEAESFAGYLIESGWIRKNDRVLDAGSGAGRHLKYFLEQGIDAYGIDLSADLLSEFQRQSGKSCSGRIVRGDFRYLPFGQAFDSVLSLFTGFGYFSDEENREVIAGFHGILRQGGRILIDVFNPGKTISELVKYSRKVIEERVIEEYRDYCAEEKRINKRIVIIKNGDRQEYYESVRCYTADNFCGLFDKAGIKIVKIIGDYSGRDYNDDSNRLIIMGEKR